MAKRFADLSRPPTGIRNACRPDLVGSDRDVHRRARPRIFRAMEFSGPRRTPLFADDPVGELRGLATLTDPDDEVAAVIDLAVIGARGDGKTQFIVHAIRALHAHAPAVEGAEQNLNRHVMRLVLDP